VSANGSSNGIVWAHHNTNPAVLYAFDAGNLGRKLYDSSQAANGRDQFGAGNKFITPMIADGKVFVGTQGGVAVFGLLP
jgi:outer membrane protein assembly factor BamB